MHVWALTSEQIVQATKVGPSRPVFFVFLRHGTLYSKMSLLTPCSNPASDITEHLLRHKRRSHQIVDPPALRSSLRTGRPEVQDSYLHRGFPQFGSSIWYNTCACSHMSTDVLPLESIWFG